MSIIRDFFKTQSDQNIHQNAPNCTILKNFLGGAPPNPPDKAHGFAMRSMSLCDIQSSKSKKIFLGPPPLPNPGDAPGIIPVITVIVRCVKSF